MIGVVHRVTVQVPCTCWGGSKCTGISAYYYLTTWPDPSPAACLQCFGSYQPRACAFAGPYEAPVKPRAPAKRKPPAAAPGAQPSTDLFDAESEGEEPSCKRQRQDDGQASQESEPGNATSASPAKKKPRKKPTSDVLDMAEAAFDDIMADDSDDEDSGCVPLKGVQWGCLQSNKWLQLCCTALRCTALRCTALHSTAR